MSANVIEPDSLTISEIIKRAADYFIRKGVDSPRLTTEILLCSVLRCDRVTLYTQHDKPLLRDELDAMREMTLRRARREPLQYIIGETEFYGLKFRVTPETLIPRPETELLVEYVAKHLRGNGIQSPRILDIGSGSGCIAVALGKLFPDASITATDISETALKVARGNAEMNEVNNIHFVQENVMTEIMPNSEYDIIASNPPYISSSEVKELEPEVRMFEPAIALTDYSDGLSFYNRFAQIFAKLLKDKGRFFVEIGYGQRDAISEIFSKAGYAVEFINDYADIPRIARGLVVK